MTETRNLALARRLWMVAFAACALWLVIQNTLLTVGYFWARPSDAAVVATALAKVAWLVIGEFWSSPMIGLVLAGTVGLAAGATLPGAQPR